MSNADTLWLNRNKRLTSFGLSTYESPMRKRQKNKIREAIMPRTARIQYITRQYMRLNPHIYFLFGDNLLHMGMGGQALEMRGEPNAVGIPTKKAPGTNEADYFSDVDFDMAKIAIDKAFNSIPAGASVIIPLNGLGTGRAQLPKRAPKIFAYIEQKLSEL